MENKPDYKLRQEIYGKEIPHNPREEFMRLAISEAKEAYINGDAPIGAIIVRRGEVISKAHNTREMEKNALHHAEILAIDSACKKLRGWRLWECEMYVTLEPCIMCSGAIVQAKIPHLYFGAFDKKGGCIQTCMEINSINGINHRLNCTGGILEEECSELMSKFFKKIRNKNK